MGYTCAYVYFMYLHARVSVHARMRVRLPSHKAAGTVRSNKGCSKAASIAAQHAEKAWREEAAQKELRCEVRQQCASDDGEIRV